MMKTLVAISMAAVVIVGAGVGNVYAGAGCSSCKAKQATAEVKKQTTCPVMGGKIHKKQFADVKGKRIYVCCPGCIGKIKADPDTYIEKLEKQGVVLDVVPKVTKPQS